MQLPYTVLSRTTPRYCSLGFEGQRINIAFSFSVCSWCISKVSSMDEGLRLKSAASAQP